MTRPNCPAHADLVRDLALGRLDDVEAARAEDARRSCATCAAWWSETIQPHADALDGPVRDVLTTFAPARQRRVRWWAAAAAAALLAVAVGLVTSRGPQPASPGAPTRVAHGDDSPAVAEPIFQLDFEDGATHGVQVERESISKLDFESGKLPSRRS